MASGTHPHPGRPLPETVYVAVYEHRFGTDIRVFLHEAQALEWRTGLAKEWWSDAFDDEPPPDDEIGAEYFERMSERDEFFLAVARSIDTGEGALEAPTADASMAGSAGSGAREGPGGRDGLEGGREASAARPGVS